MPPVSTCIHVSPLVSSLQTLKAASRKNGHAWVVLPLPLRPQSKHLYRLKIWMRTGMRPKLQRGQGRGQQQTHSLKRTKENVLTLDRQGYRPEL